MTEIGTELIQVTAAADAELTRLTAELATTTEALAAANEEIARLQESAKPPQQAFQKELFGIRVFPQKKGTTYANHTAVHKELKALGVNRISGLITPTMSPEVLTFYQSLMAQGYKFWLTVGEPHTPLSPAQWDKVAANVKVLSAGIELLSGWNEPNHARAPKVLPPDWVAQTNAHQAELWKRFNQGYQIGTPQLWSGDPAKQFTDLTKFAPAWRGKYHVIGWHYYMRHSGTGNVLDTSFLEKEQEPKFRSILNDTTSRIVCTESGFFTAPKYTGGSNPVTEAQQAALIPQLAKWYADRGYGLSYFELLDDPDSTKAKREANFGLVRTPSLDSTTWTRKPAFGTTATMLGA
jgi:hypothetical protein